MDEARWREVDRCFAEALELPVEERRGFLDRVGADDPELKSAVERLLAADQANGEFLEQPARELIELAAEEDDGAGLGAGMETLGSYRLLRRIGSGGMGTVFLAARDDAQYERRVAIKVLRSGLESTEAYHRFLAERQILARLEHPNIARLYDGGTTEDGRPFLVMELVEGPPLDEYCDRHRLTVDQRLALFRRICAAVQYAHQNLLVHRDLKPANLLVDAAGEPKLLDFGIAKQLETPGEAPSNVTRAGVRVMTPSYASPEQVRGEAITTASDVYSLGVLLYGLLTGRSPYRGDPRAGTLPHELERAICEEEPERPSAALLRSMLPGAVPEPLSPEEIALRRNTRLPALQRRLRGDLDNICLMALRKEPRRRYGSVAELNADLEGHLRDLPVVARADTFAYRTRKFLRRHRAGAAAAAGVVLLVLVFVVSLVAQSRRLAQERDKARHALLFLVDIFREADPYVAEGERLTADQILARGAARVPHELSGQPELQAAVMDAIGKVELGLGQVDKAAALLEPSLALRRRNLRGDPLAVAESMESVAILRAEQGRLDESEALLREALALKRGALGSDSIELVGTLQQLAGRIADRRTSNEPDALYQEALDIAHQVEGPAGPRVAEAVLALAVYRERRGDYERAEALYRQGLAIEEKLFARDDLRLVRNRIEFAAVLSDRGKAEEAETLLRSSLAVQERSLGRGHPDVASTLNSLAVVRMMRGDPVEAEALFRETLKTWTALFGASHWRIAILLGNLGGALQAQGKVRESIAPLEESLAIRRRVYGGAHPQIAQSLLLLAKARSDLGQDREALDLARQAHRVLLAAFGPEHPLVASPLRVLGQILMRQGRAAEAEPYLRRCVEIRQRTMPPTHPERARDEVALGACLLALGRYDEAETLLRQGTSALAAQLGAGDPRVQDAQHHLAELRSARGRRPAAGKR